MTSAEAVEGFVDLVELDGFDAALELALGCERYSRAYLRHLFNANEITGAVLATYHNLHYYLDLMHRIRNAILAGTLDDFAAEVREANL